eukprot:CAMPEP_0184299868 /NCGR_PEP_ID=MMETSP1049-20130417/10395_1 /TAXON_ID=77928 /ORGANISM="Proteomonas sulcata, Strain CCMP704" /LENGTH=64 /DNA_ID=CAMNT_0026610427 /DNA_START=622 /DNA_END=816 /DNA_ORIENTATION=+
MYYQQQQRTQSLMWGDVSMHQALNHQISAYGPNHSERRDFAAAHKIKNLIGKIRGAAISGRVAV